MEQRKSLIRYRRMEYRANSFDDPFAEVSASSCGVNLAVRNGGVFLFLAFGLRACGIACKANSDVTQSWQGVRESGADEKMDGVASRNSGGPFR